MSQLTEILISAGVPAGVVAAIGLLLKQALKAALQEVASQLTPNGGSTLYDKVVEANNLAKKAVDISIQTEARVKQVESKVDGLILSRLP